MRSPIIGLVVVGACGSTTVPLEPGSRGLRADDHLDVAGDYERRAELLTRWPENRPNRPSDPSGPIDPVDYGGWYGFGPVDAGDWFGFGPVGDGDWYRSFDTTATQGRLAETHRGAAAQILAAYEEACQQAPLAEVASSPLQRFGIGGSRTANGAIVFLAPDAGSPEELASAIRCHQAWLMLGDNLPEESPLDLAGIEVVTRGDPSGPSVEISIEDRALIPELQRRVERDLEQSARLDTQRAADRASRVGILDPSRVR